MDTKEYLIQYKKVRFEWKLAAVIEHPNNEFNHTNLTDEHEYYYRIQAIDFREQYSSFSKIISGFPKDSVAPNIPSGLKITSNTQKTVNLNWNENLDTDLLGYNIYKILNLSDLNSTEPIGKVIRKETFSDTDINIDSYYYYTITAFDEVPNESNHSNIIIGPFPPEINNSIEIIRIQEDKINKSALNLFYLFKDVNEDKLLFNFAKKEHIDISINQTTGNVTIIPEKDWNGNVTISFKAKDGVWTISTNVTIIVLPENDPPELQYILSPKNNLSFNNNEIINFTAFCNDPDLPYGDILNYTWLSNISGYIDFGNNFSKIISKPGYHLIKLIVTDIRGDSTNSTVSITIFSNNTLYSNQTNNDKINNNKLPDNLESSNYYRIFLIIFLIIICILITVYILKRDLKIIRTSKNKNNTLNNAREEKNERHSIKVDGEKIVSYDIKNKKSIKK